MYVGIIGVGAIAEEHLKAYAKLQKNDDGIILSAFCDNKNEPAQTANLRRYTNIDDFLNEEKNRLDFVDICLPTFLHYETVIKCLEAGLNVLCEKPMALNTKQAYEMLKVSEKTGKKLMIAHCNRFYFAVQIIRELIKSGELGKVRSAEFYREGASYNIPAGHWMRNGSLSGGSMLDLHIHDVDVIRGLFGMPVAVSAGAASIQTNGAYDAMSVNYYYNDSLFVHAFCDGTIQKDRFNTRTMRVNFERGYVFFDRSPGREAFVKVPYDAAEEDFQAMVDSDFYYDEIKYFADSIRGKNDLSVCPPHESAEAIAIIEAEIASANQNGARVRVING